MSTTGAMLICTPVGLLRHHRAGGLHAGHALGQVGLHISVLLHLLALFGQGVNVLEEPHGQPTRYSVLKCWAKAGLLVTRPLKVVAAVTPATGAIRSALRPGVALGLANAATVWA